MARGSWKLGLDASGEEIHRDALDRYVRLAKAVSTSCAWSRKGVTDSRECLQICESVCSVERWVWHSAEFVFEPHLENGNDHYPR